MLKLGTCILDNAEDDFNKKKWGAAGHFQPSCKVKSISLQCSFNLCLWMVENGRNSCEYSRSLNERSFWLRWITVIETGSHKAGVQNENEPQRQLRNGKVWVDCVIKWLWCRLSQLSIRYTVRSHSQQIAGKRRNKGALACMCLYWKRLCSSKESIRSKRRECGVLLNSVLCWLVERGHGGALFTQ